MPSTTALSLMAVRLGTTTLCVAWARTGAGGGRSRSNGFGSSAAIPWVALGRTVLPLPLRHAFVGRRRSCRMVLHPQVCGERRCQIGGELSAKAAGLNWGRQTTSGRSALSAPQALLGLLADCHSPPWPLVEWAGRSGRNNISVQWPARLFSRSPADIILWLDRTPNCSLKVHAWSHAGRQPHHLAISGAGCLHRHNRRRKGHRAVKTACSLGV